jgi:hypothetical protein
MSSRSLMHRVFPPSESPDGGCPQSFRLVVGGTQLCGSLYLSAIVRLQGFSSCSPAASPRRWSPETVTTSSWVGRSKPGCNLGPTLSFKDVHHPRWGGGRAEPELYLSRGFMGQPLPHRPRERALTGHARGADFDNAGWPTAGVVSLGALDSPAWLPVPPPAAKAVVAPCAREDRPRCRALPGRRSCSGAVLPLHRYDASTRRSVPHSSGRIRVGICRRADGPYRRCRGGGGSRSPRCRWDHHHHPRFGPPALCTCPRPSSVGIGEGKVAAASALRPSLLQFGHPERGSLLLLLEGATASRPSVFCCSAGSPPLAEWGCSYPRRRNRSSICNGTLNAGVFFIVAVEA